MAARCWPSTSQERPLLAPPVLFGGGERCSNTFKICPTVSVFKTETQELSSQRERAQPWGKVCGLSESLRAGKLEPGDPAPGDFADRSTPRTPMRAVPRREPLPCAPSGHCLPAGERCAAWNARQLPAAQALCTVRAPQRTWERNGAPVRCSPREDGEAASSHLLVFLSAGPGKGAEKLTRAGTCRGAGRGWTGGAGRE